MHPGQTVHDLVKVSGWVSHWPITIMQHASHACIQLNGVMLTPPCWGFGLKVTVSILVKTETYEAFLPLDEAFLP